MSLSWPGARVLIVFLCALMLGTEALSVPPNVLAADPQATPGIEPAAPPSTAPEAAPTPPATPQATDPAQSPPPDTERTDMRTAASRTFEQPDGTFITELYSDDVF